MLKMEIENYGIQENSVFDRAKTHLASQCNCGYKVVNKNKNKL